MTEEALFELALNTPRAERAALLDQACDGHPDLRARVETRLAANDAGEDAFDAPPELASTRTASDTNEASGATVGRYTLERLLGEGGMGSVWVARQTEPVKRRVAVKLIKPGMDSRQVLQRFEAERQALALMDHPNIARVLDGGMTAAGQPYFVMELVNGLPLVKFCDEAKLTPRQRLELFVPICQAVQHAHQKGIVHRDLKPANILVARIDGKAVPKVIDFGVAKAIAGRLTDASMSTQFGAVVGTLEYMSPEQAGFSGEDVDTRADLYSLGVILYELLTGLRPIDGKRLRNAALSEMIRIIREEEPSKPSTRLSTDASLPTQAALRQTEPKRLAALLRGELDWVVMKCLEKQRDRRYETANALARDVQRYLADEVVEARPPSARYRLGKFLRRNKMPAAALAGIVAALSLGGGAAAWQAYRAERALSDEAAQRTIAERELGRAVKAEKEAAAQRQAAIEAAEEAKRSEALAMAVNSFLYSIFNVENPTFEPGADVRLSAVIDAAATAIEGEEQFESQPWAKAAVRTWLGNAYRFMRLPAKALQHYDAAAALYRLEPADKSSFVVAQLLELQGKAYQDLGQFKQARQALAQALEVRQRDGAEAAPSTLVKYRTLARICIADKDLAAAEQHCRKAVELAKPMMANSPLYRTLLRDLGNVMLLRGKPVEAEVALRECAALEDAHSAGDWQSFYTKSLLGEALASQARYSEAEPHLLTGYEGMQSREAEMPRASRARLAEAMQRIAKAYTAWHLAEPGKGHDAKAADWKRKLAAKPVPKTP